ncbi:MAG: ABC transporter ATP-binding protein [Clostridia bacterium]
MKLQVKELSYAFENKNVLQNINFSVEDNEFISILGVSGCGKSTLLNILTGIIKADNGTLMIDGRIVKGLSEHFAYMPQQDLLLPWKSIIENVTVYGKIHGKEKELRKKALPFFEIFGLNNCENLFPRELSGGMRQRAAFLRTTMCSADIMLLDEPFGALDEITREEMQDWLYKMRNKIGRTTLLVTHDIDEAMALSDRILIMQGTPVLKLIEVKKGEPEFQHQYIFEKIKEKFIAE